VLFDAVALERGADREAGGLDRQLVRHLRPFCVRYILNCVRYTQP
jgi:hypothetical protein